jgi:hypothetical protein
MMKMINPINRVRHDRLIVKDGQKNDLFQSNDSLYINSGNWTSFISICGEMMT